MEKSCKRNCCIVSCCHRYYDVNSSLEPYLPFTENNLHDPGENVYDRHDSASLFLWTWTWLRMRKCAIQKVHVNIVNIGKWFEKPGQRKRSKEDPRPWTNKTFPLASSSFLIKQLLCFVHGQGQKRTETYIKEICRLWLSFPSINFALSLSPPRDIYHK